MEGIDNVTQLYNYALVLQYGDGNYRIDRTIDVIVTPQPSVRDFATDSTGLAYMW